ncbi:ABC transporter ATP-binding protein [Pseudoroseicyclus aestuarii]|uniref:Oligopeptide transport system ATP-binding protein n=1 Tax=Pseudoroseicyclus aestuarii TaxID=1795041 RepID=A0A318STT4_9RHOB|nr:dipeptide ABC transporter ATP-binding protein [Pseudoroseicyclus aestuarii]PYE82270.1 oligopeptide transport system ATP-binding protein [Pseudoroseicyclus aestuarii]
MLDAQPQAEAPKTRIERPLVEVHDLTMHFPIHSGLLRRRTGEVRAVDGISFSVMEGETLGLVGESGCGKSTAGRALLRLYDITSGSIRIEGTEIGDASQSYLRRYRPKMQMVFQDPQASLNPRMTVAAIIQEPLDEHTSLSTREKQHKVLELMDAVGLNRAFAGRYPHAFSGGQRQRIGIARALALNPKFIVCDEPIAALDVSIQAQVVNLLEDLQERFGLTYLFISHDLSMVRHIATRVAVMYLGRIVELAPREPLYAEPLHPYTRALLSAVPEADPDAVQARVMLTGDVPSPANPPKGCNFCTRCPEVMPVCHKIDPASREVRPGRHVACHLYDPAVMDGPEDTAPERPEAAQADAGRALAAAVRQETTREDAGKAAPDNDAGQPAQTEAEGR